MFNSKKCLVVVVAFLFMVTLIPVHASSNFDIMSTGSEGIIVSGDRIALPAFAGDYVLWAEIADKVMNVTAKNIKTSEIIEIDSGEKIRLASGKDIISEEGFVCWVNGKYLFGMDIGGEKKQIQLTDESNWPPDFLNDGRLAYTCLAIDESNVAFSVYNLDKHTGAYYITNIKDPELKLLKKIEKLNYSARISAHDGYLAFEVPNGSRGIEYDIYMYDIENEKLKAIDKSKGNQTRPLFQKNNIVYRTSVDDPSSSGSMPCIKIYNIETGKTKTIKSEKRFFVIRNPYSNYLIMRVIKGDGLSYKFMGYDLEEDRYFQITEYEGMKSFIFDNSAYGDKITVCKYKQGPKFGEEVKPGKDMDIFLLDGETEEMKVLADDKIFEQYPILFGDDAVWWSYDEQHKINAIHYKQLTE